MKALFLAMPTLAVAFFTPISHGYSQTTNQGELTILPGTIFSTYFDLENGQNGKLNNDGNLYLYANLNNDGEITFTEGSEGMSRFVGRNEIQQIMGSKISNLNNVIFNNSTDKNAFHLYGDLSVAGVSSFIQGIVLADGFGGLMFFEKGASHKSVSDQSHVNGYIAKRGNDSFIYPIGDVGVFRFAGITAPLDINSTFRAKYFFEDPDSLYPRDQKEEHINLINDAEYWSFFRDEGSGNVQLTLSWRDITTPAFILGETNRLIVSGWDRSENQWVNLGGDVDIEAQTVTTPLDIENYGVFTIAVLFSNMTNLSIEKTSFDVSIYEGDIFEYEIRVQNNSLVDATDVVVVDNLPNGVSFKEYELESAFGLVQHVHETIAQTLIWKIPLFKAGDEFLIKLRVRAGSPGTIINYAEVTSFQDDEDFTDNEDTDKNKVKDFFIPNVITPNRDGSNDTFEIKGLNKFQSNSIVIFNRLGDHVFEKKDYQNDWAAEGMFAGTYFYVLTLIEASGQEKVYKGWIQVIKD